MANKKYNNYLEEIANQHYVEVMDYEVRRVLEQVPLEDLIIDVGGFAGLALENVE